MFPFDNTWARELEGTYVACAPTPPPEPALVVFNEALAADLGLDVPALRDAGATVLSGARVPEGAHPIAQAYAGHQFGRLNPQLGDGRAVMLGEIVAPDGRRVDLQLKGSGRTPFSRGGDGKATLGPMLREYVMGEAMHGLGIPTTRALAVTTTGEDVARQRWEPGAVLARVASSHIRVGTFEFFALRGHTDTLCQLVAYTLARHGPDDGGDAPALALLEAVMHRQARLVAQWMGVGFIHGVLNTDNVALSGETIDFGPCAFLERHDPATVFSSIDHGGRYAYGNQPSIMAWNLTRFASALVPVIDEDADAAVAAAQQVIQGWDATFEAAFTEVLRAKIGLATAQQGDRALLDELQTLLRTHAPDHTLFFRHLADAARGDATAVTGLVEDPGPLYDWIGRWRERLAADGEPAHRGTAMDRVNPFVVPRNHRVEEALEAAVQGDLGPVERLVAAVRDPFTARDDVADLAAPAPDAFTETYQTFCGT